MSRIHEIEVSNGENNMSETLNQDDFIGLVAEKARFSKLDTKILLNAIVDVFIESVKQGRILKIKNFGRLYYQKIKARHVSGYTTKDGEIVPPKDLPESLRVVFRLAEGIRHARDRE